MTEGNHISEQLAAAWREGRLPPDGVETVGLHIAVCEPCRVLLMPVDAAGRLTSSFLPGDHLAFRDLELLVSGKVNEVDGILFRHHLESCAVCAAELADLRQFSGQPQRSAGNLRRMVFAGGLAAVAAAALFWINPFHRGQNPAQERAVSVAPPSAPAVTASLSDSGRVIALNANGALTGLANTAPDVTAMVADFLRSGALPEASATAASLAGKRELLLGETPNELPVHSFAPAGTIVPGRTPHFRWTAAVVDSRLAASRFVVSVFTPDFDPVVTSPELSANDWVCTTPLKPGATYLWTVTATVDGRRIVSPRPPEPELRFRVATGAEKAEWDAAHDLTPPSDLAQALAALKLAMYPEANEALNRLSAANPRSPLLAPLEARLRDHSRH